MAYFTRQSAPVRASHRRAANTAPRIRVQNGGTQLGMLFDVVTTYKQPVVAPISLAPAPAPPAPAPAPYAPPSGPAIAPPPPPPPTVQQPPTTEPSSYLPPTQYTPPTTTREPQGSGAIPSVTAAIPFIAPFSPVAAAAGAVIPAIAEAWDAPPTTAVRFMTSDIEAISPDGPEVYNADGTPATASAKAATFIEKIKNLPTPAKIGGVVLLYVLLSGGRR